MEFVTRRGYCALVDRYGDTKIQAEYEQAKKAPRKMNPLKASKKGKH